MKEIEQRMHNKIALMPILAFTYSTHKKKVPEETHREREKAWNKNEYEIFRCRKKAAEMSELLNNSFA